MCVVAVARRAADGLRLVDALTAGVCVAAIFVDGGRSTQGGTPEACCSLRHVGTWVILLVLGCVATWRWGVAEAAAAADGRATAAALGILALALVLLLVHAGAVRCAAV
jgi:hypothetical protein